MHLHKQLLAVLIANQFQVLQDLGPLNSDCLTQVESQHQHYIQNKGNGNKYYAVSESDS